MTLIVFFAPEMVGVENITSKRRPTYRTLGNVTFKLRKLKIFLEREKDFQIFSYLVGRFINKIHFCLYYITYNISYN